MSGIFKFIPESFIGNDVNVGSKTNTYFTLFICFFCLLVLTAILLWSNNRKKIQKKNEQLLLLKKQLFLTQIESFIINSKTPVTVQNVADFLEVSERQLYRVFKEYELTPGKFIRETKLEKAKFIIEKNI